MLFLLDGGDYPTPHGPVEEVDLHPPPRGSGTGSRLLHYFSTTRVDSRGLRGNPVDSAAAFKRLTLNVLDHKLRVVSQLPKYARAGSTPAARTTFLARRERQRGTCPRSGAPRDDTSPPTPAGPQRCFRHQLLLPSPYLVLTKPLRLDIQCQKGASVKIGWKYLDD